METIKKLIIKKIWNWCSDVVLALTAFSFVNEGFKVENPKLMGLLSLRFDLKVTKHGKESYIKFYNSGTLGHDELVYLKTLHDIHGLHIVLVTPEPVVEKNELIDHNITSLVIPSKQQIVMAIKRHHFLSP